MRYLVGLLATVLLYLLVAWTVFIIRHSWMNPLEMLHYSSHVLEFGYVNEVCASRYP